MELYDLAIRTLHKLIEKISICKFVAAVKDNIAIKEDSLPLGPKKMKER